MGIGHSQEKGTPVEMACVSICKPREFDFPPNCLNSVFTHLKGSEVAALLPTAKRWQSTGCKDNDYLWKILFEKEFGKSRERPGSTWKDSYAAEWGLRHKTPRVSTLVGHLDAVTCVRFNERVIVSGSVDKTVRVWAWDGFRCKNCINVGSPVNCLQIDSEKIVVGTVNGLKIYALENGKLVRELKTPGSAVYSLQFDSRRLIAGTRTGVHILDVNTLQSEAKLTLGSVRVCKMDDTIVVAGGLSPKITAWDVETQKETLTVTGGANDFFRCLEVDRDTIVGGGLDGMIRGWDANGQEVFKLVGHKLLVWSLQYDDVKLISGSRDRSIRVWDLRTQKCVRVLNGHSGAVRSVQFFNSRIVSSSNDCTIKVWDFGKV